MMEDSIIRAIASILSEEASKEEQVVFDSWIREDDNAALFDKTRAYWDAKVNSTNPADRNSMESGIEASIKKIEKRKLWGKIAVRTVVAASLSVAATGITFGLLRHKNAVIYTYSAQNVPVEYKLPDGSSVKLNSNSSISYTDRFNIKDRAVQLNGEAFFDVTEDRERKFIIEIDGTRTEVLGTKFNLDGNGDRIIAALIQGRIRFDARGESKTLLPGEAVVYNKVNHSLRQQKVDVQMHSAWAKGRYTYSDITFGDLMDKLSEIYDVEISVLSGNLRNRKIHASFVYGEKVSNILSALKNELGYQYKVATDGSIIIK